MPFVDMLISTGTVLFVHFVVDGHVPKRFGSLHAHNQPMRTQHRGDILKITRVGSLHIQGPR